MEKTFENWINGTIDDSHLGGFEKLLFKAYSHADNENMEKLKLVFPEYFN